VSVGLPNLEPVFQGNGYKVYRDSLALPRSFIVHDAMVMKERETVFREMTRSTFDPTSVALVEEAVEGPVLSAVEGPVLSAVEGPVLSAVEGLPRDRTLRSPAPKLIRT